MQTSPFVPAWLRRAYVLTVAVLAVSGMAQMPIFKRYYIADAPGLGWLADFYFTHALHNAAAAVLLALLGYTAARWLREEHPLALTPWGWGRVAVLTAIVATGAVRVLKNLPEVSFDPVAVMLIDWAHLGAAMLLGLLALAVRALGGAYVQEDGTRGRGPGGVERYDHAS